jgi:hypothetical protein
MTAEDPTLPPEPWGHQVDVADFIGDVVRLMAYVAAGSSVAMIWRGQERDPDEPVVRFRSVFEARQRAEIPRLLISIAAMLRAKVDDGSWNCADETVGWLSHGSSVDPERGDRLGVREACNKIIHATQVHPEYSGSDDGAQFIGALITLHGEHRRELWSAELNLQAFCIAVVNCDFYPHDTARCRH